MHYNALLEEKTDVMRNAKCITNTKKPIFNSNLRELTPVRQVCFFKKILTLVTQYSSKIFILKPTAIKSFIKK